MSYLFDAFIYFSISFFFFILETSLETVSFNGLKSAEEIVCKHHLYQRPLILQSLKCNENGTLLILNICEFNRDFKK